MLVVVVVVVVKLKIIYSPFVKIVSLRIIYVKLYLKNLEKSDTTFVFEYLSLTASIRDSN